MSKKCPNTVLKVFFLSYNILMFDNSMVGHVSFLVISICSSKGQAQSVKADIV